MLISINKSPLINRNLFIEIVTKLSKEFAIKKKS